jgi:hypothetical protein
MKSTLILAISAIAIQNTQAASLRAMTKVEAKAEAQAESKAEAKVEAKQCAPGIVQATTTSCNGGFGGCAPSWGGCGWGVPSWGGYPYGGCGGWGAPSFGGWGGCSPYGGCGGWGAPYGYGSGYGNCGSTYNYVPVGQYNYCDNSLAQNVGRYNNQNTCIGPQIQQGFRNNQYYDGSSVINTCREVVDAPETTIIRENNQKFGGNYNEVCNHENTDASKVCTDISKAALVGACGTVVRNSVC